MSSTTEGTLSPFSRGGVRGVGRDGEFCSDPSMIYLSASSELFADEQGASGPRQSVWNSIESASSSGRSVVCDCDPAIPMARRKVAY